MVLFLTVLAVLYVFGALAWAAYLTWSGFPFFLALQLSPTWIVDVPEHIYNYYL